MWINEKRYFILCHDYSLDLTYLIGRKRHRIKSLTDGYKDLKRACYNCDYIYLQKSRLSHRVDCSVIELDVFIDSKT